jgi:hypothetical protein
MTVSVGGPRAGREHQHGASLHPYRLRQAPRAFPLRSGGSGVAGRRDLTRLPAPRRHACSCATGEWGLAHTGAVGRSLAPFRGAVYGLPSALWITIPTTDARSGITIPVGTGVGNPFIVPGASPHQELEILLRDVGMSPLEALRTATLNPARVFGLADSLGAVVAGMRTELVLLHANPIDDTRNTRTITGVVLGGRFFDRRELDAQLEAAPGAGGSVVRVVCASDVRTGGGLQAGVWSHAPGYSVRLWRRWFVIVASATALLPSPTVGAVVFLVPALLGLALWRAGRQLDSRSSHPEEVKCELQS